MNEHRPDQVFDGRRFSATIRRDQPSARFRRMRTRGYWPWGAGAPAGRASGAVSRGRSSERTFGDGGVMTGFPDNERWMTF
jgi:hypothetical protein